MKSHRNCYATINHCKSALPRTRCAVEASCGSFRSLRRLPFLAQGDRTKCLKEWDEFKEKCSKVMGPRKSDEQPGGS